MVSPGWLLQRVYHDAWTPVWNTVTSRRPMGTNVFEYDWDLLVVLDSCRVDMLRGFVDQFEWLERVESYRSVGSMSAEWALKTFHPRYRTEIERTALLSRNVWSTRVLVDRIHEHGDGEYERIRYGYPNWRVVRAVDFDHYERVEATANQDDRLHPESSSIPHVLTDRAIAVGRTRAFDRMIVWYRMPHLNFFADAIDWEPGATVDDLMSGFSPVRPLRPEEKSYDPGERGNVSVASIRELYRRNLELVLEYVGVLLQNIDAETVAVTADHGEGFGDPVWGHPYAYPHAPVKTVPWAETTATDEQTYTSRYGELERHQTESERRESLEHMGYL